MAKSRVIVSGRNSQNHQTATIHGRSHVLLALLGLTVLTLGLSGCSAIWNDGWIDQCMQRHVSRLHDRVWAKRAFHLRYGHCKRVHADHFEAGFVEGYCEVCNGGQGMSPTVPPEKYWGFQYRTREGSEMQNAWYAGFEAGSGSARTDGGGTWRGLRIPQELRDAMLEAQRIDDQHKGIEREYVIDVQPGEDGTKIPAGTRFPQEVIVPNQSIVNGTPPLPTQPRANTPVALPKSSPLLPARPSTYRNGAPLPTQIVPAEIPIIRGRNQR